ncbi:MAG: hypothetical protein AB8B87_04810 [Granulosicoccus sp.]
MRKVILHIGRHKTGTTAIQRFLFQNKSLLEENGFYYPNLGIRGFGHHDIGSLLTRSAIAAADKGPDEIVRSLRLSLENELSEQDSTIVISSESFQNCDPAVVMSLFDGCDVEVIVYLREQVAYLLSAYAQKVQATEYSESLETFYSETSHSTYAEFLDKWSDACDGNIQVKNYDREELLSGNVVVDFCQSFLELDIATVSNLCGRSDANPSLTRDLLEFKLSINRDGKLSAEQSRFLFTGLSKLAVEDKSGRIGIAKELVRKATKRYEKSNRYVAKKYFGREKLFNDYVIEDHTDANYSNQGMGEIKDSLIKFYPDLKDYLLNVKI